MNNSKQLIAFLSFLIVSCSNPPTNNKNSNNNNTDNGKNNNTNSVTVLCQCKKGLISWSGPDQTSAEERVKKNCKSINGSAHNCKVID